MFNLDLLGHGLMSISTIFVGLTVVVRVAGKLAPSGPSSSAEVPHA